MRVTVDRDRCVGNGVCEALAPELFVVDDNGEVELQFAEIPPEQQQLVLDAVSSCPAQALRTTH
ncbi:ferredoxin [Mycolicibacterium diernhoferi]|uniref:Ferredoxin n=1 Tax=Mycolicibacterium diernhoferi TaxID=1801 RepID=A0A1Q4HF95_9MYCO|nr:ferredoxin [Mycolicibacterium diernhoferi]OJZ66092.1 ferredoxin [Mycolicibacterium diernhoferi]OPE55358.1 ferredoxin [Mycolicibacterium diernhoferi]PEG54548.1 ferredoxin [Mycolicibacterium diernhoferi]QYL24001.1 ferredoxin [Mycolicibacterium diernhoferi]